ncbi:hypothetical protein [Butyrivibrio sp. XPD2002]|uniref:hypothetical protein n=1 Tax=Butyrivibrio sp. XPD2002 TaxID=1280665 RepID=UPI0018CBB096|nr:hypothetical protein [Butyrivibrio sp. XPD2002]
MRRKEMERFNQREKKRDFYCPLCGKHVLGTPKDREKVNDDCQCPKCLRKYVIKYDRSGWLDMHTDRRARGRA